MKVSRNQIRLFQDMNFDSRLFTITMLQAVLTILFFIMEFVFLLSTPSDFPSVFEDYGIYVVGLLILTSTIMVLFAGFIIDYVQNLHKVQT